MRKAICAGYIFFVVGLAAADVGEIPTNTNEPYRWWLPLLVFAVVATPAFLGYMAGIED